MKPAIFKGRSRGGQLADAISPRQRACNDWNFSRSK
jgi:hypothetical protein